VQYSKRKRSWYQEAIWINWLEKQRQVLWSCCLASGCFNLPSTLQPLDCRDGKTYCDKVNDSTAGHHRFPKRKLESWWGQQSHLPSPSGLPIRIPCRAKYNLELATKYPAWRICPATYLLTKGEGFFFSFFLLNFFISRCCATMACQLIPRCRVLLVNELVMIMQPSRNTYSEYFTPLDGG